ncbi:MAG: radical SAM protein [Candidatus Omnitrophota bacterium]
MKIVIANSIGIDKKGYYIIHSPSRWTQGVHSKYQWFAYYPWELAYLSTLLKKHTAHKIKLIDGCLEKLDYDLYLQRLIDAQPDVLIIESATRVIGDNLKLALELKQRLKTKLIFVGAHATAYPQELIDSGVNDVCQGEYEYTVLDIISGRPQDKILGLYPNPRRELLDINSLPWPEDTDIRRFSYASPGEPSSEYKEIQMYASRGCPGGCNFCAARHLYYKQSNWRKRNAEDIISEIKYLKQKYPRLEGIFFDEEVHNGTKDFIMELTKAIKGARLDNLHYEAMCDIRFLDEEQMQAMKDAGYYKIRLGIESASKNILKMMNKFLDISEVQKKLLQAKKIGLKTYGTFMFGALGAREQEDKKTIELIRELLLKDLLNNLQISICTPQPGTPFYVQAEKRGYLKEKNFSRYDGGNFSVVSYPEYTAKQIMNMTNRAYLTRDYYYLRRKLGNNEFWQWIKSIYKKYRFWGLVNKAFVRILRTIKHVIINV